MINLIDKDLVIINKKCADKETVLKEIIEKLYKTKRIKNAGKAYKAILKREEEQSTGIGKGIAIPHLKSGDVKLTSIFIYICKNGIDFNSIDNKPVKIIFFIAVPQELTKFYLHLLAKISRLLKKEEFRKALLSAKKPEEIVKIIYEYDKQYPDTIRGRVRKR